MEIKKLSEEVEKVSTKYARSFSIRRNKAWFLLKLQEEVGELTQAYLMRSGNGRTKGKSAAEMDADFTKEVADVFCQVLLLAKHNNIDLEKAVKEKWLIWNK